MEANYYMIITTKEDYEKDLENNLKCSVFFKRNRKSVDNFKKGDKVFFNLTKTSSFTAKAEIIGKSFYNQEQIWTNEYDLWPCRVESKPEYIIEDEENMLHIKDIWENLNFIKNKDKWKTQVQGNFREIIEHDYNVILENIKRRCKKI